MQIFTLDDEHSKLRIVGSSKDINETSDMQRLANLSMAARNVDDNENEDFDAVEEIQMMQGARNRRPRFSVMLTSKKAGSGAGVGDIRVPL